MIKRAWIFITESDNFYVSSAVFGLSSLFAAGLNYLFYPLMAKLITPVAFGDVAAIVSLSVQITSVLLALNVVSVFVVNNQPKKEALRTIEVLQKLIMVIFIGLALACTIGSPLVAAQLKIHDISAVILLGVILILSVPSVFWTAYLQGHNKFFPIGLYNVVAAAGKVVFASILAYTGHGVFGVLLGMILGQAAGLVALYAASTEELPALRRALGFLHRHERALVKGLLGYLVYVLITVTLASTLFAADIVLAKYFFPPTTAGIYSGVGSIGRIVYYICTPIIWVMLPALSLTDLQVSHKTFRKSLLLTLAIGGACVLGLWLFRDLVVALSLGKAYEASKALLPLVGLSQLVTATLSLYIMYLLMLKRKSALLLVALCLGAVLLLTSLYHHNTTQLVLCFIGGQAGGAILYFCLRLLQNVTKYKQS